MFRTAVAVGFTIALSIASSALAQEAEPQDARQSGAPQSSATERAWQFWLRGNVQKYDNFFQASDGRPQDDVTALYGEAGASVGISSTMPLRLYGNVNTLDYREGTLERSDGVRVGLRSSGRPHSFDAYGEQLFNRPTFEVNDEFDTADIRTFGGEYAYRFAGDWQASVDGQLQHESNEISRTRDNDFRSVGAAIRWRGLRAFSPEIGYRKGERDVEDPTLSYDQREAYVQVRSAPIAPLYLSLRYRNRFRDYSTNASSASNFGREDTRRQLAANVDWTFMPALTLNVYAARESVDVNRVNRDFDTTMYLVGLTWRH